MSRCPAFLQIACAALGEDLGPIPNTSIGWLTAACNWSSGDPVTSIGTSVHMNIHTDTCVIKKSFKKKK